MYSPYKLDAMAQPVRIKQVWDFLSEKIKELKEKSCKISDEFYRKQDRTAFLEDICVSLAICVKHHTNLHIVSTHYDLQSLLEDLVIYNKGRDYNQAKYLLKEFEQKFQCAIAEIKDVGQCITDDVLDMLEVYCSNYRALGIRDDTYYQSVPKRALRSKEELVNLERICICIGQGMNVSNGYYTCNGFSQDVALKFDCDAFPILRIVPDLLQKVDCALDACQDWLRSDKVYVQQVEEQVSKGSDTISQQEARLRQIQFEYEQTFACLKSKRAEVVQLKELESENKDMNQIEANRSKIKMEISVVSRTLDSCQNRIRDIQSAELHTIFHEDGEDLLGSSAPESELRLGMQKLGSTYHAYKARLQFDEEIHSTKHDFLKQKLRKTNRRIRMHKEATAKIEGLKREINRLSKKVRHLGERKCHLTTDLAESNAHLDMLRGILDAKVHLKTTREKKGMKAQEKEIRLKDKGQLSAGKLSQHLYDRHI